jgi:type IV secretion system pilin
MKKFAKKFMTLLLVAFAANILIFSTAGAVEGENTIKDGTFNVQEHLNLNEDGQKQGYFTPDEGEGKEIEARSPIVRFAVSMIEYGTMVIGTVAMIMMILAGFRMMFSDGDEQALTSAKDMFKYTIIGVFAAFLAYILVIFVQSIFIPAS